MIVTRRKSKRWFLPSCITGAVVGLLLTTGLSTASPYYADNVGIQAKLNYGEQFQKIIETLRSDHVKPDAVKSEEELFNIAIGAIMKAIGDKHGRYFSPKNYETI